MDKFILDLYHINRYDGRAVESAPRSKAYTRIIPAVPGRGEGRRCGRKDALGRRECRHPVHRLPARAGALRHVAVDQDGAPDLGQLAGQLVEMVERPGPRFTWSTPTSLVVTFLLLLEGRFGGPRPPPRRAVGQYPCCSGRGSQRRSCRRGPPFLGAP